MKLRIEKVLQIAETREIPVLIDEREKVHVAAGGGLRNDDLLGREPDDFVIRAGLGTDGVNVVRAGRRDGIGKTRACSRERKPPRSARSRSHGRGLPAHETRLLFCLITRIPPSSIEQPTSRPPARPSTTEPCIKSKWKVAALTVSGIVN